MKGGTCACGRGLWGAECVCPTLALVPKHIKTCTTARKPSPRLLPLTQQDTYTIRNVSMLSEFNLDPYSKRYGPSRVS